MVNVAIGHHHLLHSHDTALILRHENKENDAVIATNYCTAKSTLQYSSIKILKAIGLILL
jgi:hypothetical protein